jgi:alpha-tubulin suppressor-like RCC1 family protein
MAVNYKTNDPILGTVDFDDIFVTDQWLIDKFVGNQVWTWGDASNGFLGNDVSVAASTPQLLPGLLTWRSVSVNSHVLAIKNNGTLWAWGKNTVAQLGVGNNSNRYSSPVQVGSLSNWKSVATGQNASYGISNDGTLWSWGGNAQGQLGVNHRSDAQTPIQIGALTNWLSATAGNLYAAAIKTDGTLWAWGTNGAGQLGLGNTSSYSSPVQMGSFTGWTQISAGGSTTAGITGSNQLLVWGSGGAGQLGNSTTSNSSSPVQVGSSLVWQQVSVAWNGGVIGAIKNDGTLWMWGDNTDGQVGNGSTGNKYSSPIQVGALTNWKYVSCGSNHTVALKTDNTIWAWGGNVNGQLGNGNTTSYSSPIQVGSLSNWRFIGAADGDSLAFRLNTIEQNNQIG